MGRRTLWGWGFASDLTPPLNEPQDDVWIWQDDLGENVGWTSLRPGFGQNDNNRGSGGNHDACVQQNIERGFCVDKFGVEISLGRTLADAMPGDQFAIIKHNGGSNLASQWNPDVAELISGYTGLKEKLSKASSALSEQGLEANVVGTVLVSVAGDAILADHAQTYQENMSRLIEAVRSDFSNNPEMAFFIAGAHEFADSLDLVPFIEEVRPAQRNAAAVDPNTFFIDTDDVSRFPFNEQYLGDSRHFDSAGLLDLGERIGRAYITVVPEPSCGTALSGGILFSASRMSSSKQQHATMTEF